MLIRSRYWDFVCIGSAITALSMIVLLYGVTCQFARIMAETVLLGNIFSFLFCYSLYKNHLVECTDCALIKTESPSLFLTVWSITVSWPMALCVGCLMSISSTSFNFPVMTDKQLFPILVIFGLFVVNYSLVVGMQKGIVGSKQDKFVVCAECMTAYKSAVKFCTLLITCMIVFERLCK